MKKIFFLLGVAALAVAGFIMFKILTFNDNGKEENARDGSETSGSPIEETGKSSGEEKGEGINP